jgi:signal transduction histidine kinase/ActR/RegA family two-component response regulator
MLSADVHSHPVLIFCPTGQDAMLVARLFANASIAHRVCAAIDELDPQIAHFAGAVLIAEESLSVPVMRRITRLIDAQPPWSDLPFLVLTTPGADSELVRHAAALMHNVTLIERPARAATLVSAMHSALRSRARQFQLLGYLEQREKAIVQKDEALAALRKSDERKDEFLATLAHELRNPLAPIKNSVAVMRMKGDGDAQANWARDIIDRQVNVLTRLVNDLLDVSRITRGKLELQRQVVPVKSVLDGALETSLPFIKSKGLDLALSLPADDVEFDVDRVRIAQAVSNLLINAVKFTSAPGTISLTALQEGDDIVIMVADTGVGIPPEDLSRIFELFVQGDSSRDRAQGGLGIGLTLVRQFAELHGGAISAQSDGPGRGSRFTLRIPCEQPALVRPLDGEQSTGERAPDGADAGATNGNGRGDKTETVEWGERARATRILVVDDNLDGAESLHQLLSLSGYDVRECHDGPSAIRATREFHPEVILMDIGMPGMDGYTAARAIRELPEGSDCLMIATTGWGRELDRSESAEAGFNHHFVKPIDMSRLGEVLQQRHGATVH